jgi:hypothetical protein
MSYGRKKSTAGRWNHATMNAQQYFAITKALQQYQTHALCSFRSRELEESFESLLPEDFFVGRDHFTPAPLTFCGASVHSKSVTAITAPKFTHMAAN